MNHSQADEVLEAARALTGVTQRVIKLELAYHEINTQWKHIVHKCNEKGDDDPQAILTAIEDLQRQMSERLLDIATKGAS